MTPGTAAAHFNFEVWEDGADPATYERTKALIHFSTIQRPYSKGHIRNWARMTGNTSTSTDVGTGLLYQNPVGAEVTVVPSVNYVAGAWSFGEDVMTNVNIDPGLASEMERCLAEQSDSLACALFPTLSQFRGAAGADIIASTWRNAIALLGQGTNGMAAPGEVTLYGIVDMSQLAAMMSIPEFTHAEIRGDDENPQVKGIFDKASGVLTMFTTILTTDPNGTHGCIWVPEAFAQGWNARTTPYRQRLELQNRLILANNFGVTVRHDLRAVAIRSNNVVGA